MTDHSTHTPLLLKKDVYTNKKSLLHSLPKWILKGAMWLIFIAWITFICIFSTNLGTALFYKYCLDTRERNLFRTGTIFLVFSAPILLIAFLGVAYLALFGKEDDHVETTKRYPCFRLWTFPVLVDGPFGVVSAAEIIGIVCFITYVMWAFYVETLKNFNTVSGFHLPSRASSLFLLQLTGLRLGTIGLFCLAFLFLPVARGSVLLRLIDVPFEHATKYHVWLGHLTMTIFTLHGLFNMLQWTAQGNLIQGLMEWKSTGTANLPGVISLAAGLLMWVTSLPGVRKRNFELFFYTHQLYIVFLVFLVLHVGDMIFCFAAGPVFLFMLDRFLRFWQSRQKVHVVAARSFPCGTVELVLSKPANLHYNALGWIFLQIRELSWLQWHPFSVSSSPLDGKHHLSVLVKVLGDWTKNLESRISSISEQGLEAVKLLDSCSKITASVEGPYGHESPYHLTYENLILVAGGIGISPFLAILSDVLHRINDGKPCLTRNIVIIWAIKTSDELQLLQSVDMEGICPNFSDTLNIEIQVYVTRESEPSLEEGKTVAPYKTIFPASRRCGMSVLVGTGNVIWSGIYLIASTLGLVITVSLLDIFYINPYKVSYDWYKGLLFFACMMVSVSIFGGLVIGFWHIWERKTSLREINESEHMQQNEPNVPKNFGHGQYVSSISYGQRPNFRRVFEAMSHRWGFVNIGVIVCGPTTLQTSVARECRTQNLIRRSNHAIFHFNTHSFDL